jgi:hypothetical protein
MKISCIDKQVGKLLAEAFYTIPPFQRAYSWDTPNVEDFWNDVIVDNESDYFIGNFVIYEDGDRFGVVDGQQRLTTLTLLLCALRNAYADAGHVDLAKGVHGLIERTDLSNKLFYVLRTSSSYPFLQEHIQKFPEPPDVPEDVGDEEKHLKAAYDYFRSQIKANVDAIRSKTTLSENARKKAVQEELTGIRDKVTRLKLIVTSLTNDDDAYVIFETLNTRGKDLTLSDLVKGHLSRLVTSNNQGVNLAKTKWEKIASTFDESQADLSISTFIHHLWLSQYDYVTEKKLYKVLRKTIVKANAKAFLNDLVTNSSLYRQLFEPSYRKWKKEELDVRDSLAALNLFRIRQQVPMALCLLRLYDDGEIKLAQLRATMKAIEDFHFAFTAVTSQRSSGGISFMYASAAKNLYLAKGPQKRADKLSEFRKKLSSKLPIYGEFCVNFVDLKYSSKFTKQKPLVRYILHRMYEHNSPGLSIDIDKMTIEHIFPEKPKAGSGVKEETIASIGNLILVNAELNKKMANKSFEEKRSILSNAGVWVDPVLLSAKEWGGKQIEERGDAMATQAYEEIWRLT